MPHISPKRTRRAVRALAAVLAVAGMTAAAAGCGSAPATAGPASVEKPDLTVGVVPAVSNAGVYIADQHGFFTAEGLHVKLVSITSSADVLSFLLDAKVDVLAGNYVSEIQAEANNPGAIRLRVLAEGALTAPHSREIMVPDGSPIRTLAQLRGKTVAVNALNNAASMLVDSALAADGIPASSVHLVAIGFPAEAAALNAHRCRLDGRAVHFRGHGEIRPDRAVRHQRRRHRRVPDRRVCLHPGVGPQVPQNGGSVRPCHRGYTGIATATGDLPMRYPSPAAWWDSGWSRARRISWQHIPSSSSRPAARTEVLDLLDDLRASDGSITRTPRYGWTIARRPPEPGAAP
jgi:hypothetical protein